MTTIFQMGREELASLLNFLRPTLNTTNSMDSTRLRMLITEWLLLNGLSTMHKFEKDLIMVDSDGILSTPPDSLPNQPNEIQWQMPNKVDCTSCGKYRVGRKLSIYNRASTATQMSIPTTYYEEDEKSPKVSHGGTPWDIQTPRFIKSKYGNLNRVYYLDSEKNADLKISETALNKSSERTFWNNFCLFSAPSTNSEGSETFSNSNVANKSPLTTTAHITLKKHDELSLNEKDENKCADACLFCLFCEHKK